MLDYAYIPVNGHVVANIRGRRFLFDSGLPRSIADRPLLLEDKRIDVDSEVMGLRVSDYSAMLGFEVDGVLGSNVASDFILSILPEQKRLVFDHYEKDFPINIEIENMGGLAVMHNSIGGKRLKALLNIGSKLSFIRADMVEGYEPIGRELDVFGFIGERGVDVYSLPVNIEGRIINLRFGVLPPEMEVWLEMANIEAALGSELLDHFALSLALEQGVVALDPIH
ncbi:MAG: hypothetical protein V7746_01855 [Halioglobus sp.]